MKAFEHYSLVVMFCDTLKMLYKVVLVFPLYDIYGTDHKLDQLVFYNMKISFNCQQRFWAPS